MDIIPLILIIILAFGLITLVKSKKEKKELLEESENAQTFEDKMLLSQKIMNKKLRSIDSTLDWFFWIMILGIVFYILYALTLSTAPYY